MGLALKIALNDRFLRVLLRLAVLPKELSTRFRNRISNAAGDFALLLACMVPTSLKHINKEA